MASVTPVSLDMISLSSSEDEDDDELQVLSEKIVPVKSTLELTPEEERRLLDQLNIPHNGSVKIRVKGLAGSAGIVNKRSLLGGVTTARVKVLTGGRVIEEKNMKTSKIFEAVKKPNRNDITEMFSEVMTISSSDEAESDSVLKCTQNKKVSLIKRKKSHQVTDHLVSQQRKVAEDYINTAEEAVIAQTEVIREDTTFLGSSVNQGERSLRMKLYPQSQDSGPSQLDEKAESIPLQFGEKDEEEIPATLQVLLKAAASSRLDEEIFISRKKLHPLTDHLVTQKSLVAQNVEAAQDVESGQVEAVAATDLKTRDITNVMSSSPSQPLSSINDLFTDARLPRLSSTCTLIQFIPPVGPELPLSFLSEDEEISATASSQQDEENLIPLTDNLVTQQSLVAKDVKVGKVEAVATTDLNLKEVTNVMSSSLSQPGISSINNLFTDTRLSSTCSLTQFIPPVGLELRLSFWSDDGIVVDNDDCPQQSLDKEILFSDLHATDSSKDIEEAHILTSEDNESEEHFDKVDSRQPDGVNSLASSLQINENVDSSCSEVSRVQQDAMHVITASSGTQTEVLVSIGAQLSISNSVAHSLVEEDTQDITSFFCQTILGDDPSLKNNVVSGQATTSTSPPSLSKQLDFITNKSGHPFLPTSQLTLLLSPNTQVDVVSLCPDLAADVLWDGWTVTHVSVPAAIRILDQYGDVFDKRDDLVLEQQLNELKRTAAVEKEVEMMNKVEFFARVGLVRVEEYDALAADISYRRETARRTTRLRSGSRRKKSHPEPVRENSAKRGKGKGKRRKKEKINSDVG